MKLFLFLALVSLAACSHFRYGTISWRQTSGTTATFKTDQAWRKDFGYSPCGGGSTCNVGSQATTGSLVFPSGNPGSVTVTLSITAVDTALNYFTGTFSSASTFNGAGPFQVSFYTCCRIGGIVNAPAELATTTTVRFISGRSQSSPVTNVAPIIRMMQNKNNRFFLPASDQDLDPIRFTRVAIGNGAGNINALTVDADTGLVAWNPGMSTVGYYTVVIRMEDFDSRSCQPPASLCPASAKLSDVMVDFFIQVIPLDNTVNEPVVVTPISGTSLTFAQGATATFAVRVTDADNDIVTLVPAWSVPNMAFINVVQTAGVTTATFSWPVPVVDAAAVNQACFVGRDPKLFESPLTCVTIKVGTITVDSVVNNADDSGTVYSIGGYVAKLNGKNMGASPNNQYKCRWQLLKADNTDDTSVPATVVAATYVNPNLMTCAVPDLRTKPGKYVVEASKDGTGFTTDRRSINVVTPCPPSVANPCNGQGTCNAGVCACNTGFSGTACELVCGNGKIEGAETCDDGNKVSGDGCSSTCTVEPSCICSGDPSVCSCCGNGKRELTEQCDDGNFQNGDGCANTCVIETGWSCNPPSPAPGKSVCQKCGNSYREGTEQCDDGNVVAGDGCSASCATEPNWTCLRVGIKAPAMNADGVMVTYDPVTARYKDSNGRFARPIPDLCQLCGNGKREGVPIDGGEECDDGNNCDNDGCSSTCKVEATWTCAPAAPSNAKSLCQKCGNGRREGTEECDDGNTASSDNGCEADCKIKSLFKCTYGNPPAAANCVLAASPDTCSAGIELCGNNVVDSGEECDDGNKVQGDGCSFACKKEAGWTCPAQGTPGKCWKCGNGITETWGAETCDDSNTAAGDGCSATCTIESGYTCDTTATPTVCEMCGNGKREGKEGCDDGGKVAGDGCDANCVIEPNWTCNTVANPSVCQLCGNAKLEGTEQCDNDLGAGNPPVPAAGDGCDSSCMIEYKWECPVVLANKTSVCNLIYDPPTPQGTVYDINPASGVSQTTQSNYTADKVVLKAYVKDFVNPVSYEYRIGSNDSSTNDVLADWTPVAGQPTTIDPNNKGAGIGPVTITHTLSGGVAHGKTYVFAVRAVNSRGKYSYGYSAGIKVDQTPAQGGQIIDGESEDTAWTYVTVNSTFFYLPTYDLESGIRSVQWAFAPDGTVPAAADYKDAPGAFVRTTTVHDLVNNQMYYYYLRVTNNVGLVQDIRSSGFAVDIVPPSGGSVVIDDGEFQGSAKTLSAFWSTQFTDSGSGIASIEWNVYNAAGPKKFLFEEYSKIGLSQSILVSQENAFLEHNSKYIISVRAYDAVGWMTERLSDGFTVDLTPPIAGKVSAGSSLDSPLTKVTTPDGFPVAYSEWSDPESRIKGYSIALTTTPNITAAATTRRMKKVAQRFLGAAYGADTYATNVANFTAVPEGTSGSYIVPCDLTPFDKREVYAIVRGTNGAGVSTDVVIGPIMLELDQASRPGSNAKKSQSILATAKGKTLVAAAVAGAAVLGIALAAFLAIKSIRKRRLLAKTQAARDANRQAMRRVSSAAIDAPEFTAIGITTGPVQGGNRLGGVDEVESASHR